MILLHDTPRFVLKSYGNGSALLLVRKATAGGSGGRQYEASEHFMQDDDADQFRNDLEAMEHANPERATDDILAELWDTHSDDYHRESYRPLDATTYRRKP